MRFQLSMMVFLFFAAINASGKMTVATRKPTPSSHDVVVINIIR